LTSVSQQGGASAQGVQQGAQQHHAQQSTQYKVSRISEVIPSNEGSEHFVCDLRDSPKSSAGSIRAIHFFIGDSDEVDAVAHDGEIRAIISEVPDNTGDMCSILLDSGADAAVFPVGFASCGDGCNEFSTRLHDAQGQVIPIQTMRDVEIKLLDESGKMVVLKERVAISPHGRFCVQTRLSRWRTKQGLP
jgi:hypothetical protein